MKGIIFCTTITDGNKQLQELIEQYNKCHIPIAEVCYSKNINSFVEFKNGDTWKVVKANDSARGYRCNIAYIQRSIDYNVYRTIIAPKMFDFPYAAIRLWGEGDLHISDEVPLPF